ncbi:16122_t:CDS:2, partial [Acaulospora morrowiae]
MEQQRNCVLVDKFAIFIQILLGTIAFSTLIYKRHRERPQRPLSIWAYDVSKQIIGAIIIHGLNIAASYIPGLSKEGVDSNPCVWYFLNILVDCTLGVFVLFLLLKMVQALVISVGIQGMKSGDYGQPPKVKWWLRQTTAFVFCLFTMKMVVVAIFRLCPFLFDVGEWFLGWTLHDVKLQVVFVMLIFPLIMNIVQFWIVDQVIKKKFEGMKIEDGDHSRDENEVFLPVDISDDEMNYENLPSYLKGSN